MSDISKLANEEFMRNFKSKMAKWDEYTILKTAEDRGFEKGMEIGIKKGMETVKKVGIVKNLIVKLRSSDAAVAEIAEVPVKFVKKIRRDLKK